MRMKGITVFTVFFTINLLFLSFSSDSLDEQQRVHYTINKNEWKFFRGDLKKAYKTSFNDSEWLNIAIPHDFNGGSDGVHNDVFTGRFNFEDGGDERTLYKGAGWYRTKFAIEEKYKGKEVFIGFEAVSLEAKVWVNGKEVGGHKGGYTAFSFNITDYIKYGESNTLAVKADNSNNPNIAPWMADEKRSYPFSFDYAVYGGIYRDVWITITDPVKIEKVFNTPVSGGEGPTVVSIDTRVKNYSKEEKKVTLLTTIYDPDNNKVSQLKSKKTIAPGEEVSFFQSESALGGARYWSVNNPELYSVTSEISYDGKIVDELNTNFGIRYFTLANKQPFSLNGENMLIRGTNRHQDIEGLGYALPNEQHWEDAKIIKEAGFNFIRHAHYPCDPEFAKACDELGLLLWLEIPLTCSTSETPEFSENCKSQMREMIEQHYNHPSIIVWGIGNESDRSGANEAQTNKLFSEIVELSKEVDPGRLTVASNFKYKSNKDIVDVYAPQEWRGWYGGQIQDYTPTQLISEYGADIHYDYHSDERFDITADYQASGKPDFWSQEYGTYVLEYKVSVGEERKDSFPGHCVWIAFDFASPRLGRGMNPVPYMNQKGLVLHDHKTKKDVYYFYQSMYREPEDFPMVYIVSHSWLDRWEKPEAKDVWVYSNCDSVELFNDYGDLSFGFRTKNSGARGDTRYQWDSIPIKYNTLYAEAWHNNKVVARDTIILNNLPKP